MFQSIRSLVTQGDPYEAPYKLQDTEAVCRRCYKVFEDNAKMICGGCKRVFYCSRDCQVQDWKNGHKRDCKHMAMQADQVTMAGKNKRYVKNAQVHEQNVGRAGRKVFHDNWKMIVMRAVFQECSILDCVVVIDLLWLPPAIKLKPAVEFLSKCKELTLANYSHAKRVVTRNRAEGHLTLVIKSLNVSGETNPAGNLVTSIFFLVPSPIGGSWAAYQEAMERDMPEDFKIYYREDEVLREEFLRESRII